MNRRIFLVCLFFPDFLRLPIYESIAAIFWQSASYVFEIFCLILRASEAFSKTCVFNIFVIENFGIQHVATKSVHKLNLLVLFFSNFVELFFVCLARKVQLVCC